MQAAPTESVARETVRLLPGRWARSLICMKAHRFLVVLCLFVSFSLRIHADEATDKDALVQIEKSLSTFLVKRDTKALNELLAPEWKVILSDGSSLTREQLLMYLEGGKLTFSESAVDQLEVRVYGDAAVVNGVSASKGAWENNDFSARERFTDVLIRKDGKWRCVLSHNSKFSDG